MMLMDRMVLLLIEMSPNTTNDSNLQSVMSVINKRYSLQLENGQFGRSLSSLNKLYIEKGPSGYRLGDGGVAELEEMQRKQEPFCRKFREVASPIMKRLISNGSDPNATL